MSYEERLAQAIASITQLEPAFGADKTASAQLETTAAPSSHSSELDAVATQTSCTEQPIMSYEDELELARAIASITHVEHDIEELIVQLNRLSIHEDDVFDTHPATLRQCCRC